MGFEGVEFAGYYNYAGRASELRKRLDALGLKAAGTHIGLETLQGDALEATVEFHQAIGCRFLIVPGNRAFTDPDRNKALADTFNQLADRLKPLGMASGYHNHTAEFAKDGDTTYWDLFAERTRQEVILQQDCGWTAAAGFDPVAYVRKYPGRTKTVHFKPFARQEDTGRKAILGQDSVDWTGVYAACSTVGGTEWVVVEQETYPDGRTPMEATRESLAGLKRLIG
jgi:sugar phosphate isomerase/epimerase